MKKIFCTLCKYYQINISWMGAEDFAFCKHRSNIEDKFPLELNSNNDCQNYRFSILKNASALVTPKSVSVAV